MTLLATPKRFEGLFDVIQTNAITSWTELDPRPEIILFGDDAGTGPLCERLGLVHVPDVETSERGTPMLNDLLARGQELASHDVVCFVNADIIFLPDLLAAVDRLRADGPADYLLVGQRWDLTITSLLGFEPGWAERLRDRAHAEGELMPPVWIDYFVFPRGNLIGVPDFAIGRPGYDNWLLWQASNRGATLIDGTRAVTPVHQRHDYSHVGGKSVAYLGNEAVRNRELVGSWDHYHSINHATKLLLPDGRLAPATAWKYRSARLRSRAGHALRFTRPYRAALHERRTLRRLRAGR